MGIKSFQLQNYIHTHTHMYIIHSVNCICLLFYKASTQQVTYPYKNAGCYYLLSSSVACVPFLINMSNLNLSTRFLSSFIRMHRPISVAKEQCGTVGLNSMRTTCTSPPVDGFIWTNRRHLITNYFIYSLWSIFTAETDKNVWNAFSFPGNPEYWKGSLQISETSSIFMVNIVLCIFFSHSYRAAWYQSFLFTN